MKKIVDHILEDGEWMSIPRSGALFACCDCALVHQINSRVINNRVSIQHFRSPRHTKIRRQRLGKGPR